MIHELRIPRARVAVLLRALQRIEKSTGASVRVSRDGEVVIEGEIQSLAALNVVRAVGRGFSLSRAFMLLDESMQLQVITVSGTEKTVKRLLSRVIGKRGSAKENMQRLTGAEICIYGKTVSILGSAEAVDMATTAVEDLLEGRKHSYVYSKLEKMRRLGLP